MLLAFGDSHRSQVALELIAEIILRDRPKFFVHTGDNYSDYKHTKKQTKMQGFGVRGNCDLGLIPGAPEELILDYQNKRILLTHGHTLGVKHSYRGLVERAEQVAAVAVIFGHTHVQFAEQQEGIWLVNPGSISLPRGGSPPGYACLEVVAGELEVELVQV